MPQYLVCTVYNGCLVFFTLSANGLSDVSGSKETVLQFTVPHFVLIPVVYMRYGNSGGFNSDNKTNRNIL